MRANAMRGTLSNGDKIKIIALDNKGDKIESGTAATRLIAQDKVLGIIGEMVTANTAQIMSVSESKKVPVMQNIRENMAVLLFCFLGQHRTIPA